MLEENISYCETAKQFKVSCDTQIKSWERIDLTEGSEGLAAERRGRSNKSASRQLPNEVEEGLLAEVQRHRAENAA